MALEKYLYFDKKPTNVCWNGTSFPIQPRDVIACLPGFIEAFIDPKWLKRLPKEDTRPVKYTFPASPTFLLPDPSKGLPVRSDPSAGPNLKSKLRARMLLEEPEINPYDLGVEDAVVDEEPEVVLTTNPTGEMKKTKEEEPVEEVLEELVEESQEENDETVVDLELPEPPTEEEVHADVPEEDQGPDVPLKSILRNETRGDIYDRMVAVREAGCPLKPEMLDTFNEFKSNSTRGIMFKALWQYYGFDD